MTDIVTECGKMGFDELLLDDFHYPREGRMSRIKTDERTMTQQEALALLADDIHTALEQAGYKGKLSVSVDADIALAGSEEKSGIVMSELTEKFDRVYVKVMQLSMFQLDDPVLIQIRDQIKGLDINSLTPIEALNKLNEIKKIAGI